MKCFENRMIFDVEQVKKKKKLIRHTHNCKDKTHEEAVGIFVLEGGIGLSFSARLKK